MNITSASGYASYALTANAAIPQTEQDIAKGQSVPPVANAEKLDAAADRRRQAGQDASLRVKQNEAVQEQQDQALIAKLKARDREVRAHEAAHAAVGGQYAGAPTYTYQRGPNGVSYAVGGEVSISVSEISGDPEATLQKAMQVQRAALAPAEPSAQDRKVAAQTSQMAAQARLEIAELMQAERVEAKLRTVERVEPGSVIDQLV